MEQAFWLNPDWEQAEVKSVPFWCVDPLPSRPIVIPRTPRRWHTNRGGSRVTESMTLVDAMRVINDGWDDEPRNVSFDHVRGIENVFLDALEGAARAAFGRRYVETTSWDSAPRAFLWEGRNAQRDVVHLQTDLRIVYRGLTDFISDAGDFHDVFKAYSEVIREEVLAVYPQDVTVTMCHRGRSKYKGKRSAGFIPSVIIRGREVNLLNYSG